MEEIDIAIAGGGPAGLAAANAIRSAYGDRVIVKVFESNPSVAVEGSIVLMNLNGQAAIEAIDPALLKRMEEQAVLMEFREGGSTVFNREGERTQPKPRTGPDGKPAVTGFSKEFRDIYGRNFFMLGWHEIRMVLYDNLPAGTVEHDRRVVGYEEDSDGFIRVKFQEEGVKDVRARLLIGADGYRSRIRRQLLDDGEPAFQDLVMWRARLPFVQHDPSFATSTWWRDGDPFQNDSPIRFMAYVKMTADSAALVVSKGFQKLKN